MMWQVYGPHGLAGVWGNKRDANNYLVALTTRWGAGYWMKGHENDRDN